MDNYATLNMPVDKMTVKSGHESTLLKALKS